MKPPEVASIGKNDPDAADVLHPVKLHVGKADELFDDGGRALEPQGRDRAPKLKLPNSLFHKRLKDASRLIVHLTPLAENVHGRFKCAARAQAAAAQNVAGAAHRFS